MTVHAYDAKPTLCPWCGYFHDAVSEAFGRDVKPDPGDMSLCINCGMAGIFTDDMSIRRITREEMAALDPRVQRTALAARLHCLERGPIPPRETKH